MKQPNFFRENMHKTIYNEQKNTKEEIKNKVLYIFPLYNTQINKKSVLNRTL